ncbi:hypothetical protein E2320_004895 [Naja naja]|nr:hypothetical protein E2320_004895 [Naja naja]
MPLKLSLWDMSALASPSCAAGDLICTLLLQVTKSASVLPVSTKPGSGDIRRSCINAASQSMAAAPFTRTVGLSPLHQAVNRK